MDLILVSKNKLLLLNYFKTVVPVASVYDECMYLTRLACGDFLYFGFLAEVFKLRIS